MRNEESGVRSEKKMWAPGYRESPASTFEPSYKNMGN